MPGDGAEGDLDLLVVVTESDVAEQRKNPGTAISSALREGQRICGDGPTAGGPASRLGNPLAYNEPPLLNPHFAARG